MTHRMLLAAVAVIAIAVPAQPPTKVALVHGINSNAGTWDELASLMAGDSRFVTYRTTTASNDYLTSQASALNTYLGASVGADAFLAAHSQGGLISRWASHSYAAQAILTIGTPHGGAPIAGHVDDAAVWFTLLGVDLVTSWYTLSPILNNAFHEHYPEVFDAMGDVDWLGGYTYPGIGLAATGMGILTSVLPSFNNDALGDLTPGSGFLGQLAAQLGNETGANRRHAIRVDVDGGYLGGVLRLGASAANADYVGQLIVNAGYILLNSGIGIESECSPADPDWIDHQLGAAALIDAGVNLTDFAPWWTFDIVGGYPSDMVVPFWSQGMPNFGVPDHTAKGLSHVEQTTLGKGIIRDRLVVLRSTP